MSTLITDLRHALRVFRGPRTLWLTAVLTIALGVGANSAVFSLVDGMLFRPLPYAEPDRLFMLTGFDRKTGKTYGNVPEARFQAMRDHYEGLAGVATHESGSSLTLLEGLREPERLTPRDVSPDFFAALGVRAAIGRTFGPGDDRRLLVLADRYWRRRFGGDPRVVGRTLWTEEEGRLEVLGVLPPDFFHPDLGNARPDAFRANAPKGSQVGAIVRLRAGVSLEQANVELDRLVRGLDEPKAAADSTIRLIPLRQALFGWASDRSRLLLGASAFVLLVACANLASLLLARGVTRSRELAARAALGASRWRLVRLVLGESVVLAATGGLVAAVVGPLAFRVIAAQLPASDFYLAATGFDTRVLALTASVTLLAALLAGLPAALRHTRPDVADAMRRRPALTGRGAPWLGRSLVTAEVAFGLLLLAGGSLMVKSFVRLKNVELGFTPDRVLIVEPQAPVTRYPHGAALAMLQQRTLDELESLPGVASAAGTLGIPMQRERPWMHLRMQDQPDLKDIGVWPITEGYFRTLGLGLARGRSLTKAEADADHPVAVVNEQAAKLLWGNADPVGRYFQNEGDVPREVIGVVRDARRSYLQPVEPAVYVPFPVAMDDRRRARMDVLVRAADDPRALAPVIRKRLQEIDATLPVRITRLRDAMDTRELQPPRFLTGAISLCALLAMVIAAVGIFGVVAHTAARRTHEIGIRMALGASAAQVRRLLVAQALGPVAIGLALGIVAAAASSRLLKALLFEVAPTDPPSLTAAVVVFATVAILASYVPARRASRLDPSAMLREE